MTKRIFIFSLICIALTSYAQVKTNVGQITPIIIKLKPQTLEVCNIDIQLPTGGSTQTDVRKPDYEYVFEYTPNKEGLDVVTWQGRSRIKGFNSALGCDGQGQILVTVDPPISKIQSQLEIEKQKVAEQQRQLDEEKRKLMEMRALLERQLNNSNQSNSEKNIFQDQSFTTTPKK
jgi:hypothetical protein